MARRPVLVLAVALAAATALNAPAPAHAGRRGDALASAAKTYRKQFKSAAKEADKAFADVVSGLTKGLTDDAASVEDAATSFGNALGFYASKLHAAAEDASKGFAGDAVLAMASNGDSTLAGASAGDGGSFDAFADSIRSDMAKFRAKARKRAAKFQKAIAKSEGQRGGLRVAILDWPFSPRRAPDTLGAPDPLPEPVRMWGAVATRLSDGRIIVSVFGSADPDRDETFDVRLARGAAIVRPIGDFIRDGGMDVDSSGWWSFTGVINNPFGGDTVDAGNARLHFGVDPDDAQNPQRLEHAGILSIP